jgi:hypothetical protein
MIPMLSVVGSVSMALTLGWAHAHTVLPITAPSIERGIAHPSAATGCDMSTVRLILDGGMPGSGVSFAGPGCEIHLGTSDRGMGARYAQHTYDHEWCHLSVGINHGHDLVFRACLNSLDRRDGFRETYASTASVYPYRLDDLQLDQSWSWPLSMTEVAK